MRHSQTEIRWRGTIAKPNTDLSWLTMIFIAMTLLLVWPSPAISQEAAQLSNHVGQRNSLSDLAILGAQEKQQHKLSILLNAERQKSMISDASKLLRLAQELNAELSSGESPMSTSQQAHKVAEIEKLAHNVREKMSFAAGPPVVTDGPFNASVP